jgi:redox-sensitive bicupin YhaK (pirin superfamily)
LLNRNQFGNRHNFDIRLTTRNSTETFSVPAGHRGLVYVYRGAGTVGDSKLVEGQVGLIEDGGDLTVSVADSELRLLLVAGVPIGEPVFQRGPFVMASERDLMQAFIDYQRGTLAKPMEGAEERHAQARAAKARQEL